MRARVMCMQAVGAVRDFGVGMCAVTDVAAAWRCSQGDGRAMQTPSSVALLLANTTTDWLDLVEAMPVGAIVLDLASCVCVCVRECGRAGARTRTRG